MWNADQHILITCFFQKTFPNTPNAAHLYQNDAPERSRARHSNQNEPPKRPRARHSNQNDGPKRPRARHPNQNEAPRRPRTRHSKKMDMLGNLYFQNWAFYLGESTIWETCTSKNGKRVTEGAYAFASDEEESRGGSQSRRDEKPMKHKTKNSSNPSPAKASVRKRGQESMRL